MAHVRHRTGVLILTFLLLGAIALPHAAAADPMTAWTPGPDAQLDDTYDGFIDTPTNYAYVPTGGFNVAGWFVDMTAQGWAGADDIEVWAGTMDAGRLLSKANFAQYRPDVAAALGNSYQAASGFYTTIPQGALAVGAQTLTIYAHTPDKGWWYKQVQVNVAPLAPAAPTPVPAGPSVSGGALPLVSITTPKDSENVLTKNDYDITGFALDRNAVAYQGVASTGIDRVEVYIGGERDAGGQLLGDAELGINNSTAEGLYGSQFASSGWKLTFHPTQFHQNTYLLYAYAHSVVTGKEDSAVRYFAIREQQ
jgi:hypothetical protein